MKKKTSSESIQTAIMTHDFVVRFIQNVQIFFPLILMNKTCPSFLSLSNRIIWEFYSSSEILTKIWAELHGSFPSKTTKVLARSLPTLQLRRAAGRMSALRFQNDFFIGKRNVHFSKLLYSFSSLAVILPRASVGKSYSGSMKSHFKACGVVFLKHILDTVAKPWI